MKLGVTSLHRHRARDVRRGPRWREAIVSSSMQWRGSGIDGGSDAAAAGAGAGGLKISRRNHRLVERAPQGERLRLKIGRARSRLEPERLAG